MRRKDCGEKERTNDGERRSAPHWIILLGKEEEDHFIHYFILGSNFNVAQMIMTMTLTMGVWQQFESPGRCTSTTCCGRTLWIGNLTDDLYTHVPRRFLLEIGLHQGTVL